MNEKPPYNHLDGDDERQKSNRSGVGVCGGKKKDGTLRTHHSLETLQKLNMTTDERGKGKHPSRQLKGQAVGKDSKTRGKKKRKVTNRSMSGLIKGD